MTLLLDITDLHDEPLNAGLEILHKAMAEGPDSAFNPHENPFLTELVELFHQRGIYQLDAMWGELKDILHGKHPFDPLAPHGRLTPSELSLLESLLRSGNTDSYSTDEWMLLVDYWLERYLPHDFAISQGYWLAARAVFMGRMQAVLSKPPEQKAMELAMEMAEKQPMTASAAKIIEIGKAHCTESIVSLSDSVKHRVKKSILQHIEEQSLSDKPFKSNLEGLESRLFDEFGAFNKDWRRIAVTETGEISNQAYVAGQPPGTKLKRIEMYKGACAFCSKINGLIVTVVSPSKRFKDPWKEVWAGKTNIGRSSSPMKKVGDKLVPRLSEEMWWPAAGLQHPNCRGSWLPAEVALAPGHDPDFQKFLTSLWNEEGVKTQVTPESMAS